MAEKRFIALGSTHLKDNETGKEFYAPCEWDLLDLLNELNEENKTLKKAMGFREDDNDKDIVNVLNLQQRTIVEMVEFIKQLTDKEGKIVLMNGVSYDVQKILGDLE